MERTETLMSIEAKAGELLALIDELGETDADLADAKDALIELRARAAKLAEQPEG